MRGTCEAQLVKQAILTCENVLEGLFYIGSVQGGSLDKGKVVLG